MKKNKFIIALLISILAFLPITAKALEQLPDEDIVISEEKKNDLKEIPTEENNSDFIKNEKNSDKDIEYMDTIFKSEEVSLIPENGIPLVIIRIDESEEAIKSANENDEEHEYGTIEDMNLSKHHTTRCVGTVEIIVPDDFESEYDLKNNPVGEKELSYIRGRGNSTWMLADKKPYKIKYDKKQEVLGMGKNKEWGLIANNFDPTLTHNAIASWIGEEMGLEYTPKMVPVEVVMIGSLSGTKYLGSYYLTELIDIGSNRIDINELDENDIDDISGGYLLSIYYDDQDFKEPENTVFETEYSKIKLINENPYFDEGELTGGQIAQQEYIRNYVNQIDELIMNNEEIDESIHNQIGELLDLKSTADFWLIQEFFVNFDGYKTSSNYLYKKENGKLYWGPLWDFDLMLYMVEPDIPSHVMGFNQVTPFPWLDKLRSTDPYFVELLKQEWEVMNQKLINMTKENGILDNYKERQRESWNKNYSIWKEKSYYGRDTSIETEFEILRTIINSRRQWFNDNIDNIGKVYSTVTYIVNDEIVNEEIYRTDSILFDNDLKPQKNGFLFDGWIDSKTMEKVVGEKILNDLVLIPKYVAISDIKDEIYFFLSKYEDWVSLDNEEYYNSILVYPNELEEIVLNSVVYSSSNENVATIENGVIKLISTGDTTITVSIFNGESKSYLLHVFNDSYETIDEPEDIIINESSITIEVGEIVQIITTLIPNKPINPERWYNINREVSNNDIIDVDYSDCPIVKGLKEGTATITIYLYGEVHDDYYGYKTITVNVIPKKEKNNDIKNDNSINSETASISSYDNNISNNIKNNNKKRIVINNNENSNKAKEIENNGEEKTDLNEEIMDNAKEEKKEENKVKTEEIIKKSIFIFVLTVTLPILLIIIICVLKDKKPE